MEWLWDGLPPAERVVISALAEAGPGCITQEDLERILRESGARVLIRELQDAPQLLQEWDLIEPANGGYCFRVELLRRWIVVHKPLGRVQQELDYIEPAAASLYQAARDLYGGGQLDRAIGLLQQAIELNPNHVRANELLADILLARGQPREACQLLERLYEYQSAVARPRLVQALLAQAQTVEDDEERLTLYKQVLKLDDTQTEAAAGRQRIWQQRGDTALKADDLEAALKAYQTGGFTDKVAEIEKEKRRRELAVQLQELEKLEQKKQYQYALNLAQKLASEFPKERDWSSDLERLERKTKLADLYHRALGALQSGDKKSAQTLLAQVIALEPCYEESARYLYKAVRGLDLVLTFRIFAASMACVFLLLFIAGSLVLNSQKVSFQAERMTAIAWGLRTVTVIAQERAMATEDMVAQKVAATAAVEREQATATVALAQERATATIAAQATATANNQINSTATAVAKQFGTCTEKDLNFKWMTVIQDRSGLWWPQDSGVTSSTWVAITNTSPYTGGKYCYLFDAVLVTKELTPVAKLSQLQVIPVSSAKAQVPFDLPRSLQEGQMTLTRTLYLQTYAPRLDGSMGNVLVGDPFTVSWSGNVVYDRDRDGIRDSEDCCPNDYGSSEMRGCPDADRDGFVDANPECPGLAGDWCPWVYGKYGGCPAPSPTPTPKNR